MGPTDWDAATWSAAFAAAATLFALITVLQTRAMLRAAIQPELMVHGFNVPGSPGVFLSIGNGGGGLAGPVEFIWVIDGRRYAQGTVGPMIATGQKIVVHAPAVPADSKRHEGVAGCVDAKGNGYVWSLDDPKPITTRRRRWHRHPQKPHLRGAFQRHYPALRLEDMAKVNSRVRTPQF